MNKCTYKIEKHIEKHFNIFFWKKKKNIEWYTFKIFNENGEVCATSLREYKDKKECEENAKKLSFFYGVR